MNIKTLILCSIPFNIVAQNRPNIIYIMTDQQTASAMSCMGNEDVSTPNMDRLAKNGVLMANAYCSCPLSGPSRSSMFTGFTSHEIGLNKNGNVLPDSLKNQTLGNILSESGYECAYGGKWHVHTINMSKNNSFGFDVISPSDDSELSKACVAFLEKKHTKPFFLVVSYMNPHDICQYGREQNYPMGNVSNDVSLSDCPGLPYNFSKNPYDADIIDVERKNNFSAYPTINYSADDWRRYIYAYYRLVEKVDKEIGMIVDAIDEHNLWKNTIVIFTSDHGDGVASHQWNQKSALYEECIKVPLIVTLPGKKNAGKVLPQLINNGVDFYASVCDWANAKVYNGTKGKSYRAIVENADAKAPHQLDIVIETTFDKGLNFKGWCVRTKDYKYVLYEAGRYREQLFDMNNDKGEMRNLAIEAKYNETLSKHRDILQKWMTQHHVKAAKTRGTQTSIIPKR